jgi:hypothetical protein
MINLFNLKNEILGWIAALSAIMLTIFTAFMRGKSQGKQQAEAKQNEEIIDNVAKKQQVQNDVAAMSDDAKRNELFNDWTSK